MIRSKLKCSLASSALLILLITLANSPAAFAQTGLCPGDFSEGIVSTGYVDCFDTTSAQSQRENAETDRLELEAICNTAPNSEVISSQIMVTSSGNFFASVACRITRSVPPGTILCPVDSSEVFRAFDTLVCKYFGDAVGTAQAGQAALDLQTTECVTGLSGSVLESSVNMGSVLGGVPFYYATSACGIPIPPLDVFECPFGFNENFRTMDTLECQRVDKPFESLAEAEEASTSTQAICTDTTAGLGVVSSAITAANSLAEFFSDVTCTITIPRYTDFTDNQILRACDETCTEDVEQTRNCINGGQVGGPGCSGPAIQVIVRKCNTGTLLSSACPLLGVPSATIVPFLLEEGG